MPGLRFPGKEFLGRGKCGHRKALHTYRLVAGNLSRVSGAKNQKSCFKYDYRHLNDEINQIRVRSKGDWRVAECT